MRPVLAEQNVGQKLRAGAAARAMGCEGAGGWVMASHLRHENFSRTCWITFH